MSCLQTLNGIALECNGSLGGVKEVLIANHADVGDITINDGQITAIDAQGKFHMYQFRRNTANATSTLAVDATNGSTVSTDLVMSFLRQDTVKRTELSALANGELAVIYRDANDKYWYLGFNFPVMASAGTGETGTAFTDGNRYSITLQDNSLDWPYEIKVAPATTGDTDFVQIGQLVAE